MTTNSTTVTNYDKNNQGLFVLDPPHSKWERQYGAPDLDVVAVHGLNGDCFLTWTSGSSKAEKATWLNDHLLYKLPRTRVMTFGYNASIVGNTSVAGIRDNARKLLTLLRDKREDDGTRRRPIVFIGHSLGGIIIKQALRTARNEPRFVDIADCTKGIVFFGTPHRGTDAANWGQLIASIKTASFGARPRFDWFKMLRPNSVDLMNVSEDFRPLATQYALVSFIEDNPYGKWGVIVEKHSAVLELPHEEQFIISGDHSTMCKFSNTAPDHARFDTVWRAIKHAAQGPDTSTTVEIRATYNKNNAPRQMAGNYDPAIVKRGAPGSGPALVTARLEGPGYGNGQGMLPWQDVRGGGKERVVAGKGQRWEETVEEWPNEGWK
ncbi:Alpha/Beta hydrolase protein [Parachaetomium inaequale]|uniref:Alpha/Beta hydrolase protein n=1 Tax=Parachaetomium inaequale TaxID=2588326 RepID=A0AAN6P5D2_9PEZI|nr:Alpha/Beta hydrolase protein [Parachaetomium inaequale]